MNDDNTPFTEAPWCVTVEGERHWFAKVDRDDKVGDSLCRGNGRYTITKLSESCGVMYAHLLEQP